MIDWFLSLEIHTRWALSLAVALPVVLLVLTELLSALRRRRAAMAGPVAVVRNLVVPALAIYVLLVCVAGLNPASTEARVVQTALWVLIIHAALSFVNAVLFGGASETGWQARVPALVRDLGRLGLILIGVVIVLSTVWDADPRTLLAPLGIGSLVIGLALQEPLGNVFSGVMLLFERPLNVGDWIKLGDVVGRVTQINWRSVHILTRGTEQVVVPNSILAKGSFSNYSRPTRQYAETITLGFSYDDPPNRVKRVLRETALGTRGVLPEPPPSVRTNAFEDSSVSYALTFTVADFAERAAVRDELLTRIWYVARRHGLTMPYPTRTVIRTTPAELAAGQAPVRVEELRPFAAVGLGAAEVLGGGAVAVRHFAAGEQVVAEGEPLPGLHLILTGAVRLTVRDGTGVEKEVARLGAGEFFGEKALLTGAASDVTVTAAEDLAALVLEGERLQALIDRTPQAAREIGSVMEARRRAVREARRAPTK